MKISEHVDMLELESVQGLLHPVILHDAKELIFVDTGFPLQIDSIKEATEKAGFKCSDITKIILTHQDIDHVGCIKELAALSPNLVIMAHKDEVPYIDGTSTPVKLAKFEEMDEIPEDMKGFYNQLKAGFQNRRSRVDIELIDGELLPYCGGMEIIHTPGHTPGHICIYLKTDRVLIAADELNINEGKLAGPDLMYCQNPDLAIKSVEKIKNKSVNTVLTYHGGKISGDIMGMLEQIF